MKKFKLILLPFALLGFATCHPSKKTAANNTVSAIATATPAGTPAPSSPASAPASTTPAENYYSNPFFAVTYSPGQAELTAIQLKYKEATLQQLNEGYTIYTKGACIHCHNAFDIYAYEELKWHSIIEDMAKRAALSDAEKDALFKYVLATKATQNK